MAARQTLMEVSRKASLLDWGDQYPKFEESIELFSRDELDQGSEQLASRPLTGMDRSQFDQPTAQVLRTCAEIMLSTGAERSDILILTPDNFARQHQRRVINIQGKRDESIF